MSLNPLEETKVLTEKYNGFYRGIVRDVEDPIGLGRVKTEILPMFKDIISDQLPWAEKAMVFIPPLGSWVWVFFELGDIYKPVYFANAAPVEIGGKLTDFIERSYPSSKITAPRSNKTLKKGDMNLPANAEQWRSLVEKYFPPDQVENAMAVLQGESSGNPNATNSNTNGTTDRGLFQINDVHTQELKDRGIISSEDDLYDPETNVKAASQVYSQGDGWHQWMAARKIGIA
jgi:hypothetical protein